jgi:non-ribosomal peptide synthetase component F
VELPPLPDLLEQQDIKAQRPAEQQTAAEQQPGSAAAVAAAAAPQRPYCYVLFTSGSTGRPLGVCGTEQGVLNRCRWMQEACPFQVSCRLAEHMVVLTYTAR